MEGLRAPSRMMVKGTLSHEVAVPATAGDMWAVYGGLRVGQMAVQLLPDLYQKVEVVEGDGGEGTVLSVIFRMPGSSTITTKEKFVKIDDENLTKVVEFEGGFVDLGFRSCRITSQIVDVGEADSCIVRSIVDYEIELKDVSQSGAALLPTMDTLAVLAEAIGNNLAKKATTTGSSPSCRTSP